MIREVEDQNTIKGRRRATTPLLSPTAEQSPLLIQLCEKESLREVSVINEEVVEEEEEEVLRMDAPVMTLRTSADFIPSEMGNEDYFSHGKCYY